MAEMSTRVWVNEKLWDELRSRAIVEGITVRELIPRMLSGALSAAPAATPQAGPIAGAAPAATAAPEPGPPVVVLSDVYRCDVCGGQVKVGGLTIHMGKHAKERQAAAEEERS